jgi:hypothetical protein
MFSKVKIALSVALVLGTASTALAAQPLKQVRHSSDLAASALAMSPSKRVGPSGNPTFDVHDDRGVRIGADPDPRIRFELHRDQHPGE